ncbi:Sulfhydryl oxidase [Pandoravirus macleodensis]|uniref:Sulfhydryl oxidase n=1 Tax=Pandoravirus macleodensis TaxID=2107707 RepID=A0A2U7UEU9_9VIRU|nr:Sulfhydryl oxidase [Pandoravirus macleodensis]AVK76988.1 Sulfhydryl oxidase [Pandoravirus macleodensis]UMO79647.1 Sulfhydryl oxidase [Pandoravirus aubagnensis]
MAHYDQPSQLSQQQQQKQCPHLSPRPLPLEGSARDVESAIRRGSGGDDANVMHLVGPPLWETMHYAAFQCPEPFVERAPALLDLVRAYAALLPCAECRGHFAALLAAHPPEEAARAGRQAFARWTVDAHNMVNARLGKPLVTFEQAAWRYARGDLCCRDSTADHRSPDGLAKRVLPAVVVAVALVAVVVAGIWLYYTRARGSQSTDRAHQRVQQESAKD